MPCCLGSKRFFFKIQLCWLKCSERSFLLLLFIRFDCDILIYSNFWSIMKSLFDGNFKWLVLMLCDQVERTTIACGLSPTTVLIWRWSATTSCVPKASIMSLWRYLQIMSSVFFRLRKISGLVGMHHLQLPIYFCKDAVLNLQITLWGDLSLGLQQAACVTPIRFLFSYFDASVVILSLFVAFCSSFVCLCGAIVSLCGTF